jgi:hypothetical protein
VDVVAAGSINSKTRCEFSTFHSSRSIKLIIDFVKTNEIAGVLHMVKYLLYCISNCIMEIRNLRMISI